MSSPSKSRCDTEITLQLQNGLVAILDAEDAGILSMYKWRAIKPNRASLTWYVQGCKCKYGKRRWAYLHRLILPGFQRVDHIDGNGLNNTRRNLRPCSQSGNRQNCGALMRRAGKTSRFKGVSLQYGHWISEITANGVRIKIGTFSTEEEAAVAYDAACRQYHGEFARTNFPLISAAQNIIP